MSRKPWVEGTQWTGPARSMPSAAFAQRAWRKSRRFEAQAGCGRERLGGDAAGKVARHEVRARAGRVAQRAERQRPAALHRFALGRHRRASTSPERSRCAV